jgi:hypothetical protein
MKGESVMRKVPLRTVPIDGKPEIDYRTAFITIAINAPAEGMTAKEMIPALTIKHSLEAANGADHVLLEEADWRYLVGRLINNRFPFAHEAIAEMVEAVENAPQVAVAAT